MNNKKRPKRKKLIPKLNQSIYEADPREGVEKMAKLIGIEKRRGKEQELENNIKSETGDLQKKIKKVQEQVHRLGKNSPLYQKIVESVEDSLLEGIREDNIDRTVSSLVADSNIILNSKRRNAINIQISKNPQVK